MAGHEILLQTDQIHCYGQDGQRIDCAATGQDAASIQKHPITSDQRFQALDDVVRDTLTGAVWSRDANLPAFPLTWPEALAFVADMRARRVWDRDDWQLPSRRMLFSLISHQRFNPALAEGHPFVNVFSGYYWTSETCRRLPNQAWYIHLGGGRVHRGMKHGSYLVWPMSLNAATERDTDAPVDGRFSVHGDGVQDCLTGLTWSRDADPAAGPLDWQQALTQIDRINQHIMGGHADWRMPAIRELEGLIDLDTHSPALPVGHPFVNVRDAYWSSTTSVYEPRYAWAVYLQDGIVGVGFKPGADFHLWPVRG